MIQEMIRVYQEVNNTEDLRKSLSVELAEIQRLANDNMRLMRHFVTLEEKVNWNVKDEVANRVVKND